MIKALLKSRKEIIFLGFLFLIQTNSFAQNEYFNEFELIKLIVDKEKWQLTASPRWRNNYNDSLYVRTGLDLFINRNIGFWRVKLGLGNYYIDNGRYNSFYEFRPWVGIQLNTPLNDKLLFKQYLKFESRSLFFHEKEKNTNHGRMRLNLSLNWKFKENLAKNTNWTLAAITEWYYLTNKETGERYPNSNEYGAQILRQFKSGNVWGLSYKLESFYKVAGRDDGKAHTLTMEFNF